MFPFPFAQRAICIRHCPRCHPAQLAQGRVQPVSSRQDHRTLAIYALRAEFTSMVSAEFLNLLITSSYLVCVSIWIGYLLAPEPKPASLTVVTDDEVETWNRE